MYIDTFFNTFIEKLDNQDLRIEVVTYSVRPNGSKMFDKFNIVNKDSTKRWMKGYVYVTFKALRSAQTTPIKFDLVVDFQKISSMQIPTKDLTALFEYRDKLEHFVKILNEAELPSSCMFTCDLINALERGYKVHNMRLLQSSVPHKNC